MSNPINESGAKLEEELEFFLKSNGFSYQRQKSGAEAIDFIIPTQGNYVIYADCTNQNVPGSVYEKVPHKVWKYWDNYDYDEVYIIRGKTLPGKKVRKHLNWFEETTGVKTHIVSLEEFCGMLTGKTPESPLEQFFK
mgnify:FL=1